MPKSPWQALRAMAAGAVLFLLTGCGGGSGSSIVFILPQTLPAFQTGLYYNIEFVAQNAAGNVTWSKTSGSLPPGLSLNSLGILLGTPVSSGTFPFTVKAVDAGGNVATRSYSAQVTLSFNTLLVRTRDACSLPVAGAQVYLVPATSAPVLRTIDISGETAFLGVDPPYLVTVAFDLQNPAVINTLQSYYLTTQHELIVHIPVNSSHCTALGSGQIGGSVSNFAATGTSSALVTPSSKAGLFQTEQGYAPAVITPAVPGFSFAQVSPPGTYAVSAIGLNGAAQPESFALARNLQVTAGGQVTAPTLNLAAYKHAVGGGITYPPGVSAMSSSLEYAGYELNPEGLVLADIQQNANLGFSPSSYQLGVPPGIVTAQDRGIVWVETIQTIDNNGNANILDDVDKRWLQVDGFTSSVFDGTADVQHPISFLPEPTVSAPSKGATISVTPNVNWTMQATGGVTLYRITFEQIVPGGGGFTTAPAWELFVEGATPFQKGFDLPALPPSMQAIGGFVSGRSYMLEVASTDIPPYVGAQGFDIELPTQNFRISLMRTGPVSVQP